MARGGKSTYTGKQRRQAGHIVEGYRKRGVTGKVAEQRAWATVNKMTGGGKQSGSGRGRMVLGPNGGAVGKPVNKAPAKKGGALGAAAAAKRPAAARSASARKAALARARARARIRARTQIRTRTRARARVRVRTRANTRTRTGSKSR